MNTTSTDLFQQAESLSARDIYERIMGALLKHLVLFVVFFLVTLTAGVFIVLGLPPVYISKATLMFGVQTSPQAMATSTLIPGMSTLVPQDYFDSIISSEFFMRQLEESLQASGYQPVKRATIEKEIKKALDFSIQKNGSFLDITAELPDPTATYELVKHAVDVFQARSASLQVQDLNNTIVFLDQQLALLSEEMGFVEREVKEFEEKNQITPGNVMESSVYSRLYALQDELAQSQVSLSLNELNHKTYSKEYQDLTQSSAAELGGMDNPAITVIRGEIRTLEARLVSLSEDSQEYDEVQQQITSAQQNLVEAMTSAAGVSTLKSERAAKTASVIARLTEAEVQLTNLSNKINYINAQIADYQRQHPDLLGSALEYSRMQRSRMVLESTYNLMMTKREETRVQAASETGGVKIIDPPYIPVEPEDPEVMLRLIMTGLIALMIASFGAYMADLFDNTIKSTDEIQKELNVSVLGMIPFINPKKVDFTHGNGYKPVISSSGKPYPIIAYMQPQDPSVESYRSLRTGLVFSAVDKQLECFTVSSADHADGKTLTSCNLSIAFAMGGKKTLLVDCDLRVPDQHRLFDVERTPGLSDLLVGQCEWDEVFRKSMHENLTVVPAGSRTPSPSDLLASESMNRFLARAKQEYDTIILDAPPIHVAIDAKILTSKSDGLVLVALMEKNTMADLRSCIAQVDQVDGRLFGVVFNGIKINKLSSKYYYGRFFNEYYGAKKYYTEKIRTEAQENA
ncbi:MAG TPA: polysaccharide biosynthesis tyrosine autokinase [Bacteroidetes bacterium]|nr:tyrosine-protein kinase ptk [bacterium BMS3Bbin04]HDO65016.1 polysaccharide biosynthesis tyrosine autokinase [Bacteroidota bacterium]HEX04141.1 polysaccharide biosynthesis tyrosine autokinase [Bacteroidota bacterium]